MNSAVSFLMMFMCVCQYYYSVRIFPGQEPASVWVGWVTSDFHQYDPAFDLNMVRTVTVTLGDEKGKVHERSVTNRADQLLTRLISKNSLTCEV